MFSLYWVKCLNLNKLESNIVHITESVFKQFSFVIRYQNTPKIVPHKDSCPVQKAEVRNVP